MLTRLVLLLEKDPGEVDLLPIDPDRRNGKLSGETACFPDLRLSAITH